MWVSPLETLTLIVEDTFDIGDIGGKDKVDFFMGQVIEKQSQLFYPVALLFRLTPVTLIGGFISLVILFRHDDKQARFASLLLWLFVIMVLVFANLSPKKADRYAMSVIISIDLLAGVGWVWLLGKLSQTKLNKFTIHHSLLTIDHLLITTLIAIQLISTVTSYPYVLTYYNPLLGGYAKAAELVPVGRGEGLEQAAAWINNQPDGQNATISPYYENVTNFYLAGDSLDWSKDGKKQILADYVIFYITQTQRELPQPGVSKFFQNQDPVYSVKQGDVPYVWVYKKETPVHPLEGNAEIVGRAQIVGYQIVNGTWQPASSIQINLFFITQDQTLPDNENFRVSLVGSDGQVYGAWQTANDNQWQSDSIVGWQGTLSLPQGMLVGEYKLKVSLVNTNSDTEVAKFSFEDELITVQE